MKNNINTYHNYRNYNINYNMEEICIIMNNNDCINNDENIVQRTEIS